MTIPSNFDESHARTSVRMKMLLKGTIVYNHRMSTMDCAVFDLSEDSARLRPSESDLLPDRFELKVRAGGTYQYELVHRNGDQIGVRFVERRDG